MWLRSTAMLCVTAGARSPLRPVVALVQQRRNLCAAMPSSVDDLEFKAERPVHFHKRDAVRVIELARPEALNSLNLEMIRLMYGRLLKYEKDADVRLVVARGAGNKAFCAGGDVRAIIESAKIGTNLCKNFFREEYMLDHLIGTYTLPYVSLLNGITMGGGVGISVHGLFRVATPATVFAMPETAIGLFPDVGGSYFLPRLRGHLGTFLALTGHRLTGLDVKHVGVATHYCSAQLIDELEQHLCTMAPDQINNASVAHMLDEYETKSLTHTTDQLNVVTEVPHFSLEPHLETIDKCFAGRTVEEIMELLKKDGSKFALDCHETMAKMRLSYYIRNTQSPTSMKVTLRQLQKGAKMQFRDVFPMEYRLSQRCVEAKKDFWEGVRAVLIDKCRKPVWNPGKLENVSDKYVNWFFEPFENPNRELQLTRSGAEVSHL